MVPLTRRPMNRRTLLRAAGVCVALPWLEVMVPSSARAQTAPPLRLGVFCFPYGTMPGAWHPSTAGTGYTLPANLSALTPHRDRIITTRGFGAYGLPQGSHMVASVYFTTEPVGSAPGGDCPFAVHSKSADVMVAEHLRSTTPGARHLVSCATSANRPDRCDDHAFGGVNTEFDGTLSPYLAWQTPTTPVTQDRSPQAVFDRLFGGATTTPTDALAEFRRSRGRSVLDSVKAQITSLKLRVSATDRLRLDQYFTDIFELEQTLAAPAPTSGTCAAGPRPAATLPFDVELKAWLDLSVIAMACDRIRVHTHTLDIEFPGQYRPHPWANAAATGHHFYSHYETSQGEVAPADKVPAYLRITAWYAGQLAYLLSKLKGYQEPNGDLLHNSLIVFGSGMGPSGQSHNQMNIPLVLAGELGGRVRTGRALVEGDNGSGVRMSRLWLGILKHFGVPVDTYLRQGSAFSLS